MVKTIKVNDDVYRMLNIYAGSLRVKEKRHVSINAAITKLLSRREKPDIMKCVGTWKMSEKEAEKLIDHIMEHRHSWKPRY